MHCVNCSQNIEKNLKKARGVISASVNFATEKASIDFQEKQTNETNLIQLIGNLGYKAHRYEEKNAELERKKRKRRTK